MAQRHVVVERAGEEDLSERFAAESDVARMGPGAVFEIEQRRAGVTRRLRMVPGKNRPIREYSVDGVARPLRTATALAK